MALRQLHPQEPTPGSHSQMLSPTKSTSHVPPILRVLNLVTQHEEAYRQQDVQMAELMRRLSVLEEKYSQSEQLIASLKERNVFVELDRLHGRIGVLTDQLGMTAKATQDALQQHDSKTLQLGLLSGEVDKLKAELLDLSRMQKSAVESLEQLIARQLDHTKHGMLHVIDERLKVHGTAVQSQLAEMRSDCNAASSSSEAAALQVNSFALKLRSYTQTAEQAQQAAVSRLDEFKATSETLASSIQALQADGHKVKKHVVRLQKQVEGLQTMGHVAMAAEQTARQIKDDYQQASTSMLAASKDSAAAAAAVKSLKRQLQQSRGPQEGMAELRQEITLLAESMSSCLQQLSETARRQPVPQTQSYLSTLLGAPLGASLQHSYHGSAAAIGQPLSASDTWEAARGEFDRYLHGHRMRSLAAAGSSGWQHSASDGAVG